MNDDKKISLTNFFGHLRKIIILILICIWLLGYFFYLEKVDNKDFFVLAILLALYVFDHIYSIILSARASEFFKSFMFQTAVPITSLVLVAFLSYTKSIDSQATMTLFTLSLAYTTFVVGKRLKSENSNDVDDDNKDK